MKLKDVLEKYQFSQTAIDCFLSTGVKELYPPQVDCIHKGLLDKKNILVSVPTAAGKTLMAELAMLRSIVHDQGRCLYMAPLKALASEKYSDFKEKYAPLNIKVGISISDHDAADQHLNYYDILIATAEKVDSLLRSKAKGLIDNLNVVVVDEVHFINDGSRGPTLEILIARMRQLNPKIQIVALSATISNAKEMAKWLKAELVLSTWRPIPLKEGVYYNEKIHFNNYGTRLITEDGPDDINNLVLDTLHGGGQVLIFVGSRRSAQAVAREVCQSVVKQLKPEEKEVLKEISRRIIGSSTDATKLCHKLGEAVLHGVAFHHAGLKPHQRELVETYFKQNLIKVIGCTPTLAAGVNLPARRAIIRDVKRFETGLGSAFIPVAEYKQCAGRAGRPQYDDYGEAVLIAKSTSEANTLMERFIQSEPEPIISKLNNDSSLRMHILASIAGGYVCDIDGMFEFISHTFLYHQQASRFLLEKIKDIFNFLTQEELIQASGTRYFATPLGALTSRLYIDPMSTITIRETLKKIPSQHTISPIGMVHAVVCCPEGLAMMNIGKQMAEDLPLFSSQFENDFILKPGNWPDLEDYFFYLGTLKTTWLALHWMEEEKEDLICEQFNIGPGDIYRQMEGIGRLLYAATSIAHLLRQKSFTFQLQNITQRIRYGIKEELLDIVQLKGVGRIRARILFNHGYKTITDLKRASEEKLGDIKGIGKTLARDIHAQVERGQRP